MHFNFRNEKLSPSSLLSSVYYCCYYFIFISSFNRIVIIVMVTEDANLTLYITPGIIGLVVLCIALFASLLVVVIKKRAAGFFLSLCHFFIFFILSLCFNLQDIRHKYFTVSSLKTCLKVSIIMEHYLFY